MSGEKGGRGLAHSIAGLPIIGYVARWGWYTITFPRRYSFIMQQLGRLSDQSKVAFDADEQAKQKYQSLDQTIQEVAKSQTNIANQLADIKHQLLLQNDIKPTKATSITGGKELLADEHSLDKFYIEFENNFRGSEDEIKKRLEVYLPYFKKYKTDYKKFPVLDIGCGRGELLKLLKDNDINAIGIDLNKSMVTRAKELGFKAEQAEALSYLKAQAAGSLSAITGFHIAEHIPFNLLVHLFEEAYRVLRPGGFIIFETPNPENFSVGSFSFYYDPSHLHPLPPDLLAFTAENRGFHKVEVLRLHPKAEYEAASKAAKDDSTKEVSKRLFGPQDYAVIGYKL